MIGRHRQKGFTLLELLVALTIFSLVAATVYASLSSMIATREHLGDDTERLRSLQTAWRIIGRDIEQAADRPVRSGYEDELPAMQWRSPAALALTANGRRNPAGLTRSSLQRIVFRLEDEKLVKDSWPVLDRAVDTRPFSRVILDGVTGFEVTFIDMNEKVVRSWPPEDIGAGPAVVSLPRAVNVQLEIRDWGKINRLFLIGGNG